MKIDGIEIFVTSLSARVQRIFSSGSYDTGPADRVLGKPVLVKIHAEGVTGCAQIRPISPGHFVADTTQSAVAAIKEIYGPALLGKSIFDIAAANEMFDNRLAGNPAARAVLDIALYDAIGKAVKRPLYDLIGGCCQPRRSAILRQRTRMPKSFTARSASPTIVAVSSAMLTDHSSGMRGWQQPPIKL